MDILVVDAFDSFVYILSQYLMSAGATPTVVRSNELRLADINEMRPDAILLGPGPGHPADSGYVDIINEFAGDVPVLGICLGHQAFGLAYGAAIARQRPMHGKTSKIRSDGRGLFSGIRTGFRATRYHSLVVAKDTMPDCLEVSAVSQDDGCVMGLRHRWLPIESVQFHPESICTENGMLMITNFMDRCASYPAWQRLRRPA
jgi:anthranilate synthase/aminodeoxychorismate synthase-like glutamine amidotransferase